MVTTFSGLFSGHIYKIQAQFESFSYNIFFRNNIHSLILKDLKDPRPFQYSLHRPSFSGKNIREAFRIGFVLILWIIYFASSSGDDGKGSTCAHHPRRKHRIPPILQAFHTDEVRSLINSIFLNKEGSLIIEFSVRLSSSTS